MIILKIAILMYDKFKKKNIVLVHELKNMINLTSFHWIKLLEFIDSFICR